MTDASLDEVARRIANARRLTILTGAGVSAASGVPTFRGPGGMWRTFQAADLATPEAFSRDPVLVWEWYAWRRGVVAACRPNAAHDVLARWSQHAGVRLVTQNVDDLHERAGARDVVRLHGSLWELKCFAGCDRGRVPWRDDHVPLPAIPPRCPLCGAYARPAIVWFGEGLDARDLARAYEATECDVFMSVGTSAVVYPAAGLVHQAASRGAFTIEINAEATEASPSVDVSMIGEAEKLLPWLEDRVSHLRPA